MTTVYRLINRSDNRIQQYRDASRLALYLVGWNINNYIIVKSQDSVDSLVTIQGSSYAEYVQSLTAGNW